MFGFRTPPKVKTVSRGVCVTPADLEAFARQLHERQYTAISLVAMANKARDDYLDSKQAASYDAKTVTDFRSVAARKPPRKRTDRIEKLHVTVPAVRDVPPCHRCGRAKHAGDCFTYHRSYKQWETDTCCKPAKHWPKIHTLKHVLQSYGVEKTEPEINTTKVSKKPHKVQKCNYRAQTGSHAPAESYARLAWANRMLGNNPYSSKNLRAIERHWPRLINKDALTSSQKPTIKI